MTASCKNAPCYDTRGPTVCVDGTCLCMEGYCSIGIGLTARCRAQVPDSSCHASRICWKGGMTTSGCHFGRCLCKTGFHVDEKGVCVKGWWPSDKHMEMAAQPGWDAQIFSQEQNEMVLNLGSIMFLVSVPIMLASSLAVFIRRRLQRNDADGYEVLDGTARQVAN